MSGVAFDPVLEEILPSAVDILRQQGVPADIQPSPRVTDLARAARAELADLATPGGLIAGLTPDDFAKVYTGDGRNEEPTPLAKMIPQAESLALFAVTVGAAPCDRIAELFDAGDYALGGMLDAAASLAAEGVACAAERLQAQADPAPGRRFLRYSPGYCGWHVSGQRALLDRLDTDRIGLTLLETHLMVPLKSVSGVILGAPPPVHRFADDFDFCADCATHECRDRIAALVKEDES